MELKTYIYPLIRWWWLLALATLAAAVSSLLVTSNQPPVYQSTVTLMMGRAMQDPNPSANELWLGQQLAGTYADIANREMVRNATMQSLGWNWLPTYKATARNNSQLIVIAVVDTLPERAQLVANELAKQLILQTPTNTAADEKDRQQFVSQQLDTLEAQIKQTQEDIAKLQADLGSMVSARQINDTQNQIAAQQAKLNTLTSNYAGLLSNTQRGAVNTLSVIEPAALPRRPIGPNKPAAVLVASMIGFAMAAAAAFLLEYLDDTVKSPDEIQRLANYPIIAYINEVAGGAADQPFVAKHPRHPYTEAFRTLRTNMEFANVDNTLKTVLFSSADTGDGKTSVAVNLGVVMAQGEKKVALVDADMRLPSMHEFMGMTNENGLSDIFRGRVALQNALRPWKDGKVAMLPGGTPPPNPAELLGSQRMDQVIKSLENMADMVIIDGPPFVVADAAVLASKVDGIVLVIRPGYTRRAAIKAMVDQVQRTGVRVLGVVLNRIPNKLGAYYTGRLHVSPYYMGSSYFQQPGDTKPVRALTPWKNKASKAASTITRAISSQGTGKGEGIPPAFTERNND